MSENTFVKKKSSLGPVVLMAAVCFGLGCLSFLRSVNFRALAVLGEHGMNEVLRQNITMIVINLVRTCVYQLVGLGAVVIVCAVRKKRLSKICYKDAIAVSVFLACTAIAGMFSSTVTAVFLSRSIGANGAAAYSAANAGLAMFDFSLLLNWVGIAIFILARTDAKVFAWAAWGGVSGLALLGSICLAAFAVPILKLLAPAEEVIAMAVPAFRAGAAVMFVPIVVRGFFFLAAGRGLAKFIPAVIYGPVQAVLNIGLDIGVSALVLLALNLGLGFAGLGVPVAYVFGGIYLAAFALVGGISGRKKAAAQD